MANTVKTIFLGDAAPLSRTQAQIQRDMERYRRDQDRREKEITRVFEREARLRQAQEQKSLREAERDHTRMVRERERQEKAITQATLREIRIREQAQREAAADAKFQAQQLETFRQGVLNRQSGVSQSTSLFGRLSFYQKAQLSYQANDIISGLAMGQSPFQILTQQGGQIVQIFQQSKEAQEGVVKATNAAATAQKIFAANSKEAAAEIAKGHQSITLLGASAVGLGSIVAAGLVTITAVYLATQRIREEAEKRLKNEREITAEWNKQHGLISEIAKERAKAESGRNYDRFLDRASISELGASRTAIEQQIAANQKAVTDEQHRRQLLASQLPQGSLPENYITQAGPEIGALSDEKIKELTERLKTLDAQIYTERQRLNDDYNKNVIEGAVRTAASVREQVGNQAVEQAKKRIEELEKQKKKLEEVKQAQNSLFDQTLSRSDNPFLQFLGKANSEMRSLLETAKNLPPALRAAFAVEAQRQNRNQLFGLRLDSRIDADNLRRQAQEYRQGFRTGSYASSMAEFEATFRQGEDAGREFDLRYFNLRIPAWQRGPFIGGQRLTPEETQSYRTTFINDRIQAERNKAVQKQIDEQLSVITRYQPANDEQRALINQRILNLASQYDPSVPDPRQRGTFASAFEREAERKITQEKTANNLFTQFANQLKEGGLKVRLADGEQIVRIINEAPEKAKVSSQPRKADSNAFFGT